MTSLKKSHRMPGPGSAVLNDPRFETVLQGPEGYYVPRAELAPPDWH